MRLNMLGGVIAVIGLILLVGSIAACPAKYVAIPTSLVVLLIGLALYAWGRKHEEIKK
ncbi:MAG: hypothetical protein ACO2OS_06590 [Thermosphaera aggregans]|jgi:predicted tellurium resistance membrane protein TerC|uniref:hypothetical protein n=1 Tax=Thermosphaera aggregans TaxID=54254 RepID=UPI003BFD155F